MNEIPSRTINGETNYCDAWNDNLIWYCIIEHESVSVNSQENQKPNTNIKIS